MAVFWMRKYSSEVKLENSSFEPGARHASWGVYCQVVKYLFEIVYTNCFTILQPPSASFFVFDNSILLFALFYKMDSRGCYSKEKDRHIQVVL